MVRTADGNTIIGLANETTASCYYYEVTPAMADFVASLSEEELGQAMPAQGTGEQMLSAADEAQAYADALEAFALEQGADKQDAVVRPIDIPTYWFESGWSSSPK